MDNGTLLLNDTSYSGDGGTLVMNGKIYSGNAGIDVSDTTATQADVLSGKVFHTADGSSAVGTLVVPKVVQGTITPATTDSKVNLGFKPSIVYVLSNIGATSYFGAGLHRADGTTEGSRYGTGSTTANNSPCIVSIQNDGFTIRATTSNFTRNTIYIAIG